MKGIPLIIEPAPCSCFLRTSLCCRMRFLILGACRAALLLCSILSQSTAHFPFGSQHECHWNSSAATSLPELVAYQRFSLLTVMVSIPFHAFHAQNVSVEPLHSGCMVVCRHSQERSIVVLLLSCDALQGCWVASSYDSLVSYFSQCSHGLVYKWLKDDEIRRYLLLATVLEGFLAENEGIPCNCSVVTPPCFVELRSTQGIAGGSVLVRCSVAHCSVFDWFCVFGDILPTSSTFVHITLADNVVKLYDTIQCLCRLQGVHLYVVCLLAYAGTRQWRTTVLGGFCQFSITAKYVKNLQLHVSKGNVLC